MLMRRIPIVMLLVAAAPFAAAQNFFTHSFSKQHLTDVFYCEGASFGDFNNDKQMDIVSGAFWYEGPDFKKAHAFYEPKPFDPKVYSNNFFAFSYDFNKDGWNDILILGFPGKDASWFENPGKNPTPNGYWKRHQVLDVVDNESPTFVDVTGDGIPEILCQNQGFLGYAPINQDDPTKPWTFVRVSDKPIGGNFTHGLGYGDVNGDGKVDILEKGGWWEQPASLEGNPVWKKHPVPFSPGGGAQMYAYDIDGDGDNDVITSLAAHGYGLAWYEQVKGDNDELTFTKHVIINQSPDESPYGVVFSQLHAVDLIDMDGDGLKDIVTGKRYWAHGPSGDPDPGAAPVVYWFRLTRGVDGKQGAEGVEFVPHLIDDDSGVGTQVVAGDINNDGLPDIIIGNKKGTYVLTHKVQKVSEEQWKDAQPKKRKAKAAAGLTPQEAARNMTVPPGFRVDLIAGEPRVHQPVAFTIDHKGRLWIAEAHTYPQRAPEGQGKDRIIILEDTDGNGSFETSKTFIEGLNLVSGMEVGFGGVWVGAAPYLLFIPDRNGDDKPDAEPTVLLDGFGYQDTHETLNAFIWGPDGWLYGCHGVFTHSRVGKPGTPDDQRTPMNCAVWRYHPTRHVFEIFAEGTSNPWGVDFDDHGQTFITACVIPHMYHMIQGGRYQRQGGQHFNPYTYDDIKSIADHRHYAGNIADHAWWGRDEPVEMSGTDLAGGGHAHCGAMIYLGDNWPDKYRNGIFMANIHGNRVNHDIFRRNGSGYIAGHGADLLLANDQWFRGINLKYGPDGGVFLIDWYDKNACHRGNPEIWDRTNGRVYKITYGQPKPVSVDLSKLSDAELVKLHEHRNDWYVRTARRILQERGVKSDTHTALRRMIETNPDATRKLRALWTLHTVGGLDEAFALGLLDSDNEFVRSWAIQLSLEDRQAGESLLARLAKMSQADPSPVVRLYLASALQRLPLDQRWAVAEGLLAHADDAKDHNLPLMYWYGVEPLVMHNVERAMALAGASRIGLVTAFITRRAASDPRGLDSVLTSLGSTNDPASQNLVLGEIVNAVKDRANLPMPKAWPDIYDKLAQSSDANVRQRAQFITVKFGDERIFPMLRRIVADGKAPAEERHRALDALMAGKDKQLGEVLLTLLDDSSMRGPAIRALAAYDLKQTPQAVLSRYAVLTAAERTDAVNTLAARPAYADALLDAIAAGRVPRADLSAFNVRQMLKFDNKSINDKVNTVWGAIRSTTEDKAKLIADYKKQLTANALAKADLPHGREVYTRTCAACHTLFGAGATIGPDLTGSDRANLDYILENIVDPSAVVGRDYQLTTIQTKDNQFISGMIKSENDSAITVQLLNMVTVVPKADIAKMDTAPVSMMPENQLATMTADEVRDLIAYLASARQVPLPGQAPVFDTKTGKVFGAIEGESMRIITKTGGDAGSQKMDPFTKDKWSGDDQLWWTGGKPGDKLILELPVKNDGPQELFVVMTKARDYGIVQLYLNDQKLAGPIDLYNNPDVITTGPVSLGTHDVKAGNHRLTIEITGTNPKAVKAYMFALDYAWWSKVQTVPPPPAGQ